MADIRQAAVWLREGKMVRRKGESYGAYIVRLRMDRIACRVKVADLHDHLREARIGSLDEATQRRLKPRYTKALLVLEGEESQEMESI